MTVWGQRSFDRLKYIFFFIKFKFFEFIKKKYYVETPTPTRGPASGHHATLQRAPRGARVVSPARIARRDVVSRRDETSVATLSRLVETRPRQWCECPYLYLLFCVLFEFALGIGLHYVYLNQFDITTSFLTLKPYCTGIWIDWTRSACAKTLFLSEINKVL